MMGGLWGLAASTAMEQCHDIQARGILSGIYESGASFGFIVAAAINYLVGQDPPSWKFTFWVRVLPFSIFLSFELNLIVL